MAHVLDSGELAIQRLPGQWSKAGLAIPEYHIIYTALLNGVPSSNDMVAEITVDTESGTRANVLPDMTLYVGTTAGAYDLGMCRIRKTPIAGTFYIGEASDVVWADNCYLTVMDDYQLWQKSLRVVSEVPYMDWDIAYSNQHASFDPVPAMGCDRVAKLVNGTVNVLLGPASDTPAWVIGSTISSRLWSIAGASAIDNTGITNPTATFTSPGTYLAYCLFTATNGKTFKGVRYIVIWDDENLPLQNFQVRNGRMSSASGSCSFDVTLHADFNVTTLRKRSKVILFTEDFAQNNAITLPGQIPGAENILCEGWITDIDTSRQSEFGEISFTVESAEYWMRKIRDYPSGLEFVVGAAAAWTDMPAMNVQRALWHFLHWRSTATRIMDIQITDDARYATRFQTARANLWERLYQVAQPTIFAAPGVDNFGRLFIEIEPQMVPEDDRTWPVVMTLTDDDIENNISWRRRDVKQISMLFFSGISVDSSAAPLSFFSMSPGHSYEQFGEEEPQDNYLVESQQNSNDLCGLYYGWRNNDPYDLQVNFVHSMRIAGVYPRQKFYYEVSAADDPRGIGFAKNFIIRDIDFEVDLDTGFLAFSATLEPESVPGPAIDGDVPTMDNIDFSVPDFPDFPRLPFFPSIPIIPLPPTVQPTLEPTTVVIYSATYGIMYTKTFDLIEPVWYFMNSGLTTYERSHVRDIRITGDGHVIINVISDRISYYPVYEAVLGGVWQLVFNPATVAKPVVSIATDRSRSTSLVICLSNGTLDGAWIYTGDISGVSLNYHIPATYVNAISPVYASGQIYVFFNRNGVATTYRFSLGGGLLATIVNAAPADGALDLYANNGNNTDDVVVWSGASNLYKVTGRGVTWTALGETAYNPDAYAVSPGKNIIITSRYVVPHASYISTDGGATWGPLTATIPVGSVCWENCGDDYRFLFGSGAIVRLTMDQGASYEDKMGNLLTLAPLTNISRIRFVR